MLRELEAVLARQGFTDTMHALMFAETGELEQLRTLAATGAKEQLRELLATLEERAAANSKLGGQRGGPRGGACVRACVHVWSLMASTDLVIRRIGADGGA